MNVFSVSITVDVAACHRITDSSVENRLQRSVAERVASVVEHVHEFYSLLEPVVAAFLKPKKDTIEKKLKVKTMLYMPRMIACTHTGCEYTILWTSVPYMPSHRQIVIVCPSVSAVSPLFFSPSLSFSLTGPSEDSEVGRAVVLLPEVVVREESRGAAQARLRLR